MASASAAAHLEQLLNTQLKALEAVICSSISSSSSSSTTIKTQPLTSPTQPCLSPPTSSDGEEEEAFYTTQPPLQQQQQLHQQSPPPTQRTALEAHLSQVQRLLIDSDFVLQQRVFAIWKRRAWNTMRLRVRLRGAFNRLKHLHRQAIETRAQLAKADMHAIAHAGRKGARRLGQRVAERERRVALVAHGHRVLLERRGRRALSCMIHRIQSRKRAELLALQQRTRLLSVSLRTWRHAWTCEAHLRRRGQTQVARCFAHWREVLRTEKQYLMELTVVLRARKALFAMVNTYRKLHERSDEALYLMTVRRLKVALARWWLDGCQRRRTARLTESLASAHNYQTRARRGLAAFVTRAQQQREAAQAWQVAAGLHATHLGTRILREWLHAARVQAFEMETQALQGMTAWIQHQEVVAFGQLRAHAQRQRKSQTFRSALLTRSARCRLGQWREWARKHASEQSKLEQHRNHGRQKQLSIFLQRWQRYCRLNAATRGVVRLRQARQAQVILGALSHAHRTQVVGRQVQLSVEQKVRQQCLRWWVVAASHAQALRYMYMRRGLRLWRISSARQQLQRGIEEDLGAKAWRRAHARQGLQHLCAWVVSRRQDHAKEAAIQLHLDGVQKRRCRAVLLDWRTRSKEAHFRWLLEKEAGSWAKRQQKVRGLVVFAQFRYRHKMEGMTLAMALDLWAQQRRQRGLAALRHMLWTAVKLPAQTRSITRVWTLQRALGRWVLNHLRTVGAKTRETEAVACTATYFKTRRLATVLGYLKRNRALVRQQELVQERVRLGTLVQTWRGWRGECMRGQKLRNFQRRRRQRLVKRVFGGWRDWSQKQPVRRAMLAQEILKARQAKCFRAWRGVVQHRLNVQSRAMTVAKAANNTLMFRALVGWTEALVDVWRERRADQLYVKHHGLQPWRLWVQQRKQEQALVAQMQTMDARHVLRTAWRNWQEAQRLARREESAVQTMAHARAVLAWERWKARAKQKRQERAAQAHHLARQLGYWRRYVARVRKHAVWLERLQAWSVARPTVVQALFCLFPSGQKLVAWNNWLAFYGARLQDRNARECGDIHYARKMAMDCLQRLHEQAQVRKYVRVRESFNQGLAVHLTKAKAFQALQAAVLHFRQNRLATKRQETESRLARERRQLLKQVFLRWSAYTKTMHMTRTWLHSTKGSGERTLLPASN